MDMHYPTQTLVEVAYEALKKDIAERVLVPGQKIILREVNERYGISETPIKQALNRLIAEGVVESIPRKGVRVRKIKWEEIVELMDIRLMVETYYIKQVMRTFKEKPQIKEEFLRNLRENKEIIGATANVDNHFKNYCLDLEFHQLFLKCSENKRIMQIYNNLGTHTYAYYVYGKQGLERVAQGVKEHENIYNALVAQDEAEVRRCIEEHINNAKNRIYEMLKKDDAIPRLLSLKAK